MMFDAISLHKTTQGGPLHHKYAKNGVRSVAVSPPNVVGIVVCHSVGKVDNRFRLADHLPFVLQVFYLLRKVIGLHALHQVSTIGAEESVGDERHEFEQDVPWVAPRKGPRQLGIAVFPCLRLLFLGNGAGSARDVAVLPFQRVKLRVPRLTRLIPCVGVALHVVIPEGDKFATLVVTELEEVAVLAHLP